MLTVFTSVVLLLLVFSSTCGGEGGERYLQFRYEAEVVARSGSYAGFSKGGSFLRC